MGAVESLDHCCTDRSDEKTNKKFMGSWRTPPKKAQKIDLNRDYGKGAAICDDPLKDLKLDKSIDAELAIVFKEVGHRFPCPIHGEEQLMKILKGFRRRGYDFPGSDDKICARVWSMHNCSRVTILQFRAWFHAEVVVSKKNLRNLLSHSRWFSAMVKRMHSESDHADDKMDIVRTVVNTLRSYLEEDPVFTEDLQKTSRRVMEERGRVNYLLSGRGKILIDDFEAIVQEMLVQMYHDHFSDSLYDDVVEDVVKAFRDVRVEKQMMKRKPFPITSLDSCGLPNTESGLETWRRISETLPVGDDILDAKKSTETARYILERSIKAETKFPSSAPAA